MSIKKIDLDNVLNDGDTIIVSRTKSENIEEKKRIDQELIGFDILSVLNKLVKESAIQDGENEIEINGSLLGVPSDNYVAWNDVMLNLFNKMKDFGCFKNYWNNNDNFVFKDLDLEKVKEYGYLIKKRISADGISEDKKNPTIELPPSIAWEDITIKFFDGHDINIILDSEAYSGELKKNYAELGFQNKTTRKPNAQWDFLKILNDSGGEITWESQHANVKIKKTKQLLSNQLKKCFGLSEDPFFPYKQNKSYQIKINFVSPKKMLPVVASDDASDDGTNSNFRIKEYLSLIDPLIDDYKDDKSDDIE